MKAEIDIEPAPLRGEDLTGRVFLKRTVISFEGIIRPPNGKTCKIWKVRCKCGKIDFIQGTRLKSGNADSCGCEKASMTASQWLIHGDAKKGKTKKMFRVWCSMRARCFDKNCRGYKWYGARGITVCERWMEYKNFKEDMEPSYQEGLTINRTDNDGNYEPQNCCWVTWKEQVYNRRPRNSCFM